MRKIRIGSKRFSLNPKLVISGMTYFSGNGLVVVAQGLFLEVFDRRHRGEYLHLTDGDLVEAFEAFSL